MDDRLEQSVERQSGAGPRYRATPGPWMVICWRRTVSRQSRLLCRSPPRRHTSVGEDDLGIRRAVHRSDHVSSGRLDVDAEASASLRLGRQERVESSVAASEHPGVPQSRESGPDEVVQIDGAVWLEPEVQSVPPWRDRRPAAAVATASRQRLSCGGSSPPMGEAATWIIRPVQNQCPPVSNQPAAAHPPGPTPTRRRRSPLDSSLRVPGDAQRVEPSNSRRV